MFEPLRRLVTHEELFVERYDALLRAALRVTEGDRQAAQDLVQDAFIRFTLVQPPLDEVERLDAYLYAMLRNMHTSRVRRICRVSEVSLSILDFDSLDIGLEHLDARRRVEVRQTLRAACDYGCLRRLSSKVGSLFLLRFFHGYLPSEIARIARLPTAIVDERLFCARREVKLFVEHPDRLTFIETDRTVKGAPPPPLETDNDSEEALVRHLRATIFSERHVPCWSKRTLRELYRADRTEPLTREQLAALVACPVCLDEVNAILSIASLASRWPTDTLGPGTRSGGGSERSASLASARRRAGAVFEHRPRQLRVLVNGFELGSHTIDTQPSELVLTANVGEPVALVELFSEQGLCLLFLDASPPPNGQVRQRRRVELSDGRHAEIEITFGSPWPTVRAGYFDPRGAMVTAPQDPSDEPAHEVGVPRRIALEAPRQLWTWRPFGLRPAPAMLLVGAVVTWLLFWTPGAEVSAAERIANTIRWFVARVIGSPKAPASPPSSRVLSPAPAAAPLAPASEPIPRTPRSPPLTAARRMALELRAIAELQHVDAYLGQEVSFGPGNDSRIEMRAIVDGGARKQALERALGSLIRGRDVHAEITNLRQMAHAPPPPEVHDHSTPREFVFVKDQFPMFEPLRQYFRYQHDYERRVDEAPTIDQAQIDLEVRRFAIRLLNRSRRASQHAWALQHLADRFPSSMVRAASVETQELWETVVREHARGYRHESALLRTALEPVIQASGLLDFELPESPIAPGGASDPWSNIPRLLELQKAQDEAMQAALAIQTDDVGVSPIQTRAFWRLLDEADALAAGIAGAVVSR
jgi:DNA-directed RNA polymerase specialized sigma24 family protein